MAFRDLQEKSLLKTWFKRFKLFIEPNQSDLENELDRWS